MLSVFVMCTRAFGKTLHYLPTATEGSSRRRKPGPFAGLDENSAASQFRGSRIGSCKFHCVHLSKRQQQQLLRLYRRFSNLHRIRKSHIGTLNWSYVCYPGLSAGNDYPLTGPGRAKAQFSLPHAARTLSVLVPSGISIAQTHPQTPSAGGARR